MGTIDVGNTARNQPEDLYKGISKARCRVSLSASLSAGDVHRIGKIPHGAIPLDAVFYPGSGAAAGLVAKFGTSASQEMFFASATYSQAAAPIHRCNRQLGSPRQVSLSDDAMPRYEHLVMVATAGVSIGYVGELIVYYEMPAQTI